MLGKVNVGGASGGYALEDKVYFKLDPMKDGSGNVHVYFSDPQDSLDVNAIWKKTVLLRKETSVPQKIDDGELILENRVRNLYKEEPFVDLTSEDGKQYFYRVFPIAKNGVISRSECPYDDVDNAKKIFIMGKKGIDLKLFKSFYAAWSVGDLTYGSHNVKQYLNDGTLISTKEIPYYEYMTDINVDLDSSTQQIITSNAYRYNTSGVTGAILTRFKIGLSNIDHNLNNFTKLKITINRKVPSNLKIDYSIGLSGTKYTVSSGNISSTEDERTFSFDLSAVTATAFTLQLDWSYSPIKNSAGSYNGIGATVYGIKEIWLE